MITQKHISHIHCPSLKLGNSCYQNCVIQCLYHTGSLVDYLNQAEQKGQLTFELTNLFKAMARRDQGFVKANKLKETVGKFNSIFGGNQQQDCQEFLLNMLQWLKEETTAVDHESIIGKMFTGKITNTLSCQKCGEQKNDQRTVLNSDAKDPIFQGKLLYLKKEKMP